MFSGSYKSDDVQFLLKPIAMAPTPVNDKERLIQSGEKHYSEIIAPESVPSTEYIELFTEALSLNRIQLAEDILRIAVTLADDKRDEYVIVSLARAGTPIGILLHRTLKELGHHSRHYSVSIIRDRGIDGNALAYILGKHRDTNIIFVDGWTGKGAIAQELSKTIQQYNLENQTQIDSGLTVVSDLAGVAKLAANSNDYLIASSILNAIVSGLISRTILNADYIGPSDFHGCIFYESMRKSDLSRHFVDDLFSAIKRCMASGPTAPITISPEEHAAQRENIEQFVQSLMKKYALQNRNRIKPGIGEATSAILRRMPDLLLLRSMDDPRLKHLIHLCEEKKVTIEIDPQMPVNATTIIKKTS